MVRYVPLWRESAFLAEGRYAENPSPRHRTRRRHLIIASTATLSLRQEWRAGQNYLPLERLILWPAASEERTADPALDGL